MQKTMSWVWLVFASVTAFQAAGCAASPDIDAEKRAIAKVVDDNIGWFRDKDFDLLFSTMTNGPDLFMYQLDTASTIRGFEAMREYSAGWRNPAVRYAGHSFHDLDVTLSRGGDAAWFATQLKDCAAVGDRPARCFTTRYTGVLEKRDDRWLIVQQHFSLPADLVAADWAARTAHPPTEDRF